LTDRSHLSGVFCARAGNTARISISQMRHALDYLKL